MEHYMNKYSTLLTFFAIIIIASFLGLLVQSQNEDYIVELSFCDNRAPVRVIVTSQYYPTNSLIETYNQAVPNYKGYLNVCNIKVIETIHKK